MNSGEIFHILHKKCFQVKGEISTQILVVHEVTKWVQKSEATGKMDHIKPKRKLPRNLNMPAIFVH